MNTANDPKLVAIYKEVVEQDTYMLRPLRARHSQIRVAVDLGASFGPAAKFIKNLWPDAVVHAFEPDRARFALLKDNLAEFSQTTCHNFGLCGVNKNHVGFDGYQWRKSPDEGWQTALCCGGKEMPQTEKNNKLQLRYVLDVWPANVDLLKIDIEGFEWSVIEDLAAADKLPKIIVGEWHFNNALSALITLLEPTHKFEFRRPDPNPWGPFWAINKKFLVTSPRASS